MNNVWWAIVNFFRKLFVPPESTFLERELARQISNLESQLHREREKYDELVQRLLFPTDGPVVEQKNVSFSVPTPLPPVRERAKELSDLSRRRWQEHADSIITEAEERLKNRGKEANFEEGTAQVESH